MKKANDEENYPSSRIVDIEILFHEVTHCRAYLNYSIDDMDKTNIMYQEGSATFHMKFANRMNYEKGGSWSIAKTDESVSLDYQKDNCTGYLTYLNAYEKLIFLLGFDTIYKFENDEITYEEIGKMLTKKYGKDVGGKLFSVTVDWYLEYEKKWNSDKTFNLAIQYENTFFECLKMDIAKLKTKEEAEEFIRLYDHYKKRNMPVTVDENGAELPTVFDVASVDKALKTKAKSFGITYNT